MISRYTPSELKEFESDIANLFEQAKIPFPVHLSGGNEEQLIEIYKEINKEDFILSTHRPHYHYLLAGGLLEDLQEKIMKGNSLYVFNKDINFLSSAIVGGCPAIAAGVALGLKRKGLDNHVWCFVGDGGEDSGHFYEAVRYVEGFDLPCTFIIEDNNLSVETPKEERYGKFQVEWPKCVRRYHYKPIYPHVGTGKFIDFTGKGDYKGSELKPGASF